MSKPELLEQNEIYSALSEIGARIEACGCSEYLTHAVSLVSDLRRAIGNDWNPADAYSAEIVRRELAKSA